MYEGMVVSTFNDDQRPVLASPGSSFYNTLCGEDWPEEEDCIGTIDDFVQDFFGGKFQRAHLWYDIFCFDNVFDIGADLDLLCA